MNFILKKPHNQVYLVSWNSTLMCQCLEFHGSESEVAAQAEFVKEITEQNGGKPD